MVLCSSADRCLRMEGKEEKERKKEERNIAVTTGVDWGKASAYEVSLNPQIHKNEVMK